MKKLKQSFLSLIFIASLSLLSYSAQAGQFDYGAFYRCATTRLTHFNGTIAQAAAGTKELSTLYSLVGLAGLGGALSGPGPLTVYAPVNSAFAKIPAPLVNLLTSSPKGLLTKVLTYHVSPGIRDPRRYIYPTEVGTLQGQTVFLDYENKIGPQVNQSTLISCRGVRTTNGVVWLIDSVLLPQF